MGKTELIGGTVGGLILGGLAVYFISKGLNKGGSGISSGASTSLRSGATASNLPGMFISSGNKGVDKTFMRQEERSLRKQIGQSEHTERVESRTSRVQERQKTLRSGISAFEHLGSQTISLFKPKPAYHKPEHHDTHTPNRHHVAKMIWHTTPVGFGTHIGQKLGSIAKHNIQHSIHLAKSIFHKRKLRGKR